MLEKVDAVNSVINNFIWGVPAMICIIGVGLYLSFRTRFLQIRKFPYAMKVTFGRMFKKKEAGDGALTPFQAVCTALAATVGTGNVAGVAGAIAIGGPVRFSGCGYLHCSVCVRSLQRLHLRCIFARKIKMAIMSVDRCIILRMD